MQSEIVVAVIAFLGTLLGTFGGIVTSNKLTNHRLQELERKVDRHNTLIERTFILEEKMKNVDYRIKGLEEKQK